MPTIFGLNMTEQWLTHLTKQSIALLIETFPNNIISHNSDTTWFQGACDLTPLEYFLWKFLESNASQTFQDRNLGDLKTDIIFHT